MTFDAIKTFVIGWAAGVVTPLLVEFFKRRLFDRPKLQIRVDLVPGDPENIEVPPFLHVSAVNSTDIPIILNTVFYTISYEKQAVGIMEDGLPKLTEKHKLPLKLMRHEEYEQSVELIPWIKDFLNSRTFLYEDESPLNYSKLKFEVSFLDTTENHWDSKKIKLNEDEVRAIRQVLAKNRSARGEAKHSKRHKVGTSGRTN